MAPNESNPRRTILVVDDTPDNLALVSGVLRDDYRVRVAIDGEKALRIAGTEPPPDMILLDVMMPGLDGYEVCRRLKAEPSTRAIRVIFLTACYDAEDARRGLSLGAVDYVTKPISPTLLLERARSQFDAAGG